MDETEKKLITRFCLAERLKSEILTMMQVVLRLQDYRTERNENPDGKTVVSWFLNALYGEINRAAAISKSKYFTEAQSIIAGLIPKYDISDGALMDQGIVETLRTMVTKITSEAADAAKELQF